MNFKGCRKNFPEKVVDFASDERSPGLKNLIK